MSAIAGKIKRFLAKYEHEIILAVGVILISLISFAAGYLYASQTLKEPLHFEHSEPAGEEFQF